MSEYYNRKGQPISSDEWSSALKTEHRVAETVVNGYWVSTVWLGRNYRFGDGEPLIFETMAFPHDGNKVTSWLEVELDRYATEDEARAGHDAIVARLSKVGTEVSA